MQRAGLKYMEDLKHRIPREEVTVIEKLVQV